jgi:hypothetical protein
MTFMRRQVAINQKSENYNAARAGHRQIAIGL